MKYSNKNHGYAPSLYFLQNSPLAAPPGVFITLDVLCGEKNLQLQTVLPSSVLLFNDC